MKRLSEKQELVLRAIGEGHGFDGLDYMDFIDSGALWFLNRDRVIGALQRKGLIDDEYLTPRGLEVLASIEARP